MAHHTRSKITSAATELDYWGDILADYFLGGELIILSKMKNWHVQKNNIFIMMYFDRY